MNVNINNKIDEVNDVLSNDEVWLPDDVWGYLKTFLFKPQYKIVTEKIVSAFNDKLLEVSIFQQNLVCYYQPTEMYLWHNWSLSHKLKFMKTYRSHFHSIMCGEYAF